MNLHRVSTHISPIASETAAQRTVFGHWKSRPARAPRRVGLSWKHTRFPSARSLAASLSKSCRKTRIGRVVSRARPTKSSSVDAKSKRRCRSADAAVAPRPAARSDAATTATAAAAAATTATATAAAAAATTAAPGHLLHRAALLLVEQVERREADVGDFFFTQRDRLRRHEAQFLRRISGRGGRCRGTSRKTKSQTRSTQRRHGGFNNSLPF
jgi:hypothetical protein